MTTWSEFEPDAGIGFEFFENAPEDIDERAIPKTTSLHRSRKRVIPNFRALRATR
jgi:hypothetical protein